MPISPSEGILIIRHIERALGWILLIDLVEVWMYQECTQSAPKVHPGACYPWDPWDSCYPWDFVLSWGCVGPSPLREADNFGPLF